MPEARSASMAVGYVRVATAYARGHARLRGITLSRQVWLVRAATPCGLCGADILPGSFAIRQLRPPAYVCEACAPWHVTTSAGPMGPLQTADCRECQYLGGVLRMVLPDPPVCSHCGGTGREPVARAS